MNSVWDLVTGRILLRIGCVSNTIVEKLKTRILYSITVFFPHKIVSVYEIMWKKYGLAIQSTDDNITWRLCRALHAG